jgi:hypothetical protein
VKAFVAAAGGIIEGSFTPLECELLGDLTTQVIELLEEGSDIPEDRLLAAIGIGGSNAPSSDPAIARLLPNAYLDDHHSSQEFRRLTENSLVRRKVANAQLVKQSLAGSGELHLDARAQQAWLRSLADIRIIIASRLGIEHDDDEGHADTDDEIMMHDVYIWLGIVQGSLVDALDA